MSAVATPNEKNTDQLYKCAWILIDPDETITILIRMPKWGRGPGTANPISWPKSGKMRLGKRSKRIPLRGPKSQWFAENNGYKDQNTRRIARGVFPPPVAISGQAGPAPPPARVFVQGPAANRLEALRPPNAWPKRPRLLHKSVRNNRVLTYGQIAADPPRDQASPRSPRNQQKQVARTSSAGFQTDLASPLAACFDNAR